MQYLNIAKVRERKNKIHDTIVSLENALNTMSSSRSQYEYDEMKRMLEVYRVQWWTFQYIEDCFEKTI